MLKRKLQYISLHQPRLRLLASVVCVFLYMLIDLYLNYSQRIKCPYVITDLIFLSFQAFGDYYHFRHRTLAKRSLSDHRGTQVRLLSDPKVRILKQ